MRVAAAALVLGACASPREHFYSLLQGDSGVRDRPSQPEYTVIVGTVTVPADIDRPELVVRDPSHRVAVLEQERWIEPLPAGIRRALARDLAQRLRLAHVPYEEIVIPNEIHGFLRWHSWLLADQAAADFLTRYLRPGGS